MGRSVLGIMDDGGEEGWKERVADEILGKQREKDAAAAREEENAGEGGGGGGGEA